MNRVKRYEKLCLAPGCDRLFNSTRRDAKTCSDSCRKALSRLGPRPPSGGPLDKVKKRKRVIQRQPVTVE